MDKLKHILKEGILESKDTYNTPAAIAKEKSIGKKKVNPEDSITDLDLNTLNRNQTVKEYSYGHSIQMMKKVQKSFGKIKQNFGTLQ